VRAHRDPDSQVRTAIERAVAHPAREEGPATPVQLLGQISGHEDWPAVREYWTRRAGLTGSWPAALKPGERALNLWPCAPGSVRLTSGIGEKPAKRQPRQLLSTPALIGFDPSERYVSEEGALAQAIVNWVDDVVLEHDEYPRGVLLAPPILEDWEPKGRLVSRTIHTFGVDWQLPAAEDVIWPPS
jgi:hypothetical protein